MALPDAWRTLGRVVAAAVYVVVVHALLSSWWRPGVMLSTALEALVCAAAVRGLTRWADGRWRGPAFVGLLAEALRAAVVAGMGDRPAPGAAVVVVPACGALAAWVSRRTPGATAAP